ncbi:hypothetical protein GCM10010302_31280 [Streptomyces polychromogenes]|uniref:Uncharacterized protein n=1 Tax=Streptomyces polychromogenes TaxID=67342 RepID=A0ABN0VE17_9ACTN
MPCTAEAARHTRPHAEISRAQALPVAPSRSMAVHHVRLREYLGVLRAARLRAR